jgi:hypothetical protein
MPKARHGHGKIADKKLCAGTFGQSVISE